MAQKFSYYPRLVGSQSNATRVAVQSISVCGKTSLAGFVIENSVTNTQTNDQVFELSQKVGNTTNCNVLNLGDGEIITKFEFSHDSKAITYMKFTSQSQKFIELGKPGSNFQSINYSKAQMLLGFDGTSDGAVINGISPITINDTCEFNFAL